MADSEISWNSVPGLEVAAAGIEAVARQYGRIMSHLDGVVNLVNPETFGEGNGAEEFYAKFENDFTDWYKGALSVGANILATSKGVFDMAEAFSATDKNTKETAEELGKNINGGLNVPGGGGPNNPNNPNNPDIPPLPPTTGGGNSGGGNPGRR